jgi:hypothetical protein
MTASMILVALSFSDAEPVWSYVEPAAITQMRESKLTDVQSFQLKRHDVLAKTMQIQFQYSTGSGNFGGGDSKRYATIRHVANLRLELITSSAERAKSLENLLQIANTYELLLKAKYSAGVIREDDYLSAVAFTLEIETMIAKEKAAK